MAGSILSLQHAALPLNFDWRFIVWRATMFSLLALLPAVVLPLVARPVWQAPLLVALAAVVALFVLTFVHPELWQRGLVDLGLIAALAWAWRESAGRRSLTIGSAQLISHS